MSEASWLSVGKSFKSVVEEEPKRSRESLPATERKRKKSHKKESKTKDRNFDSYSSTEKNSPIPTNASVEHGGLVEIQKYGACPYIIDYDKDTSIFLFNSQHNRSDVPVYDVYHHEQGVFLRSDEIAHRAYQRPTSHDNNDSGIHRSSSARYFNWFPSSYSESLKLKNVSTGIGQVANHMMSATSLKRLHTQNFNKIKYSKREGENDIGRRSALSFMPLPLCCDEDIITSVGKLQNGLTSRELEMDASMIYSESDAGRDRFLHITKLTNKEVQSRPLDPMAWLRLCQAQVCLYIIM